MTSGWFSRRKTWGLLFVLLAFGAVIGYLCARQFIRCAGTSARLQHIALALHNYHGEYDCFPPQYVVDGQGKPAHSWRVLILPYLGYGDLYARYRFDEPWNGPHNRLLATEMPYEYRSPFLDSTSTVSQYVGIAGESTPWQGATPLRWEDASRSVGKTDSPDDVDSLVWFIEMANSDVHWMEPRDAPLEQALVGLSVAGAGGVQSNYPDALPVRTVLDSSGWIPVGTSRARLLRRFTLHDSEQTDGQEQPSPQDRP